MKSVFIGLFGTALIFGASACHTGAIRSDGTPPYNVSKNTQVDTSYTTTTYRSTPAYQSSSTSYDAQGDNSKVNERITKNSEWTAEDQGSSESDIKTTQEIRKQVVDQNHFSSNAKNIKIITRNGEVVLKGPVKTMAEKNTIDSIAKRVAGHSNVTNVITVTK